MPLEGLERRLSKSVDSDAGPRPTTGCSALPGALHGNATRLWRRALVRCNCDGSVSVAFYDTDDCRGNAVDVNRRITKAFEANAAALADGGGVLIGEL